MPSPLQKIVQQAGKRACFALDGPDTFSAKRACGGFNGYGPISDIENMAPPQVHEYCLDGERYGERYGVGCAQHANIQPGFMMQQGCQHANNSMMQQQGQRTAGDVSMMFAAELPFGESMELDGSQVELGGAGRFARFPPRSVYGSSPTHYHKSTAIGYIPPMNSSCGSDESVVRAWECEYMGKNDYY